VGEYNDAARKVRMGEDVGFDDCDELEDGDGDEDGDGE